MYDSICLSLVQDSEDDTVYRRVGLIGLLKGSWRHWRYPAERRKIGEEGIPAERPVEEVWYTGAMDDEYHIKNCDCDENNGVTVWDDSVWDKESQEIRIC